MVATPIEAQVSGQSIQGLVMDSTGAVVAGAKVAITNIETNVSRSGVTNSTGNYSFPLVPVGTYNIQVELDGFKTERVTNIRVETGAQVRQNVSLEIGNVTESIEVAANAVTLQTENATIGSVVENRRIIELPLNGRNIQNLAVLVPGVQYGLRTGLGDGGGGFPIPGQGFSVSANGQRETHQVFNLDGVDAKDPRVHIGNFVPSVEAIEEFKIETNSYSAEVGWGGGARVNITMKSGTNDFHGTFFNFLRNDVLDAEAYFLNFELAPGVERQKKNTLRQNQFGTVLSGPVLIPGLYDGRNKTFWAFNYEGRRVREGVVQTAWWPTDEFRQGDFSQIQRGYTANGVFVKPVIIYDPFTGDPFPNNVIPQSRLHPGSQNILDLYVPRAQFVQQDPIGDFTARAAVSQPIDANTYFARGDHYFTERDRVFGRLAWDRSGLSRLNINPNIPVFVDHKVTNLSSQWIHTFSQNMINEFRFGFNVSDDITKNPRTDNTEFDQNALGVGEFRIPADGNRELTPREHGIPQFTGIGFTLQELTNGNGFDNMDTIQFGNHISWVKGTHNIKMGGEFYRVTMERGAANLEEGRLGFAADQSGLGFASFLLGTPFQTQTPEGLPLTYPRANRFGLYIHDDWKATSRLTINIGMRFDYNGFPVDARGLWRTVDIPGLGAEIGRGEGYTKPDGTVIPMIFPGSVDENGAVKLARQQVKFFMPRLGIAYRPSDKWVLRLGAGWFDNLNHINTFTIFNLMPPKAGSQIYTTSMVNARTISAPGADGNNYNIVTRKYQPGSNIITLDDPFLTRGSGQAVVRPVDVLYLPPDYKDGQVWKWSFDVQRELPGGMALTVGYAGSKGANVGNSVINWNDPLEPSATFVQANRPYPEFYDPATPELGVQGAGRYRYIDSFGESFYHGLQTKLEKRYSRGLTFGIAYTYSKAHGDGENGGQEGSAFSDPRDRKASRGLFRFDQTHRTVANFVWELPGGNLPGALKYVLGNWQANGIVTIASGFPFNISQSANDLSFPNGQIRPDMVGDPNLDNPTRKLYYNPQAFERVTCKAPNRPDKCRIGSTGYNALRGFGQRNIDFSFYKNIPMGERFKLQFRWEAFNALNTPWFGNPGNVSFSSLSQLTPDGSRNGEIRSLLTPMRRQQFGLKFFF